MLRFHRAMTRPFFSKERIGHFDIFDTHTENALQQTRARISEGHAVDFQVSIISPYHLYPISRLLPAALHRIWYRDSHWTQQPSSYSATTSALSPPVSHIRMIRPWQTHTTTTTQQMSSLMLSQKHRFVLGCARATGRHGR